VTSPRPDNVYEFVVAIRIVNPLEGLPSDYEMILRRGIANTLNDISIRRLAGIRYHGEAEFIGKSVFARPRPDLEDASSPNIKSAEK
jgi:hypothetical protein